MLTLIDNPFDYFTNFREWLKFDIEHSQKFDHKSSCELLARTANLEDDMTQKERDIEIERAIDEILEFNPLGIWKKVSKTTEVVEPMDI